MTKYNGWTNYETWRVNLEMIDGIDPHEMGWSTPDEYELGQILREHCNEVLEGEGNEGFALQYARAFLDNVNWREIAKHMVEAYGLKEEKEEEEETSHAR